MSLISLQQLGKSFDSLNHIEQVALVVAAVENTVTHQRLCSLGSTHPADSSRCLQGLVARGFLEQTGSSRGAVYHLSGTQIPGPEDVFDSQNLEMSSLNLKASSPNLDGDPQNLDGDSPNKERDNLGRLISDRHALPFVEDLKCLTPGYLETLHSIAAEPRTKKKVPREVMQEVLLKLLDGQFVTISCLAKLVSRDPETLRGQYLSAMVKSGELEIAFPRTPNDLRQAYTKGST